MKLAKFVKFREEKFGGVLFETRAEKVFTLNPVAVSIVRRIQAGDSEPQIIAALKASFRDSRGTLEREALLFIADLRARGLVENA